MITGASSGIGYETALKFAEREENLILIARNKDNLKKLKELIVSKYTNIDVIINSTDLSDPKNIYELYEKLKIYDIHTLVNNAGIGDISKISDQDFEKTQKMIRLNIEALTILTSLFVKDYENYKGTQVINIASTAGYAITPLSLTYSASKYYVATFTEGLDALLKLKGSKMRAKVLAPSYTETKFMDRCLDQNGFDYNEYFNHFNTAEEVAKYLIKLYDSNKIIGIVNEDTLELELKDQYYPIINHENDSIINS